MKLILGILIIIAGSGGILAQGTTDFSGYNLVGTVSTYGEYDNAGLSTWNGQPLTSQNQPTAEQDQLSATLMFYVNPIAHNQLFLTVQNVLDTDFGYINGAPFSYVALTGLQFTLPTGGNTLLNAAIYSSAYALPGQTLNGSQIDSFPPGPLTVTPGWSMTQLALGQYTFSASSVGYAFSHFPTVTGSSRIEGGGVFELTFDPSVNLLTDVNWNALQASASNGMGLYEELGTLLYPVPEPSTITIGLAGLCAILISSHFKKHFSQF